MLPFLLTSAGIDTPSRPMIPAASVHLSKKPESVPSIKRLSDGKSADSPAKKARASSDTAQETRFRDRPFLQTSSATSTSSASSVPTDYSSVTASETPPTSVESARGDSSLGNSTWQPILRRPFLERIIYVIPRTTTKASSTKTTFGFTRNGSWNGL